jgi:hypothetical protein
MTRLKQLFSTILLAMALCASVHAGDMQMPPADPPPDHMTSGVKSPATDDQGNRSLVTAPDADAGISITVFDLLRNLLSMY